MFLDFVVSYQVLQSFVLSILGIQDDQQFLFQGMHPDLLQQVAVVILIN